LFEKSHTSFQLLFLYFIKKVALGAIPQNRGYGEGGKEEVAGRKEEA